MHLNTFVDRAPPVPAGELMRSPDTYSLLVRGTEERREGTVRKVKGIPPQKKSR